MELRRSSNKFKERGEWWNDQVNRGKNGNRRSRWKSKENKAIWKRRLSNGNSTASQFGQSFDLKRREDVKASFSCFS